MIEHSSPCREDVLSGQRILITGGSTGLGRGMARHLAENAAQVHLWGRREAVLQEAADEAPANAPGNVHIQTVDVKDYDQVDAAMEQLWTDHGALTGVINNAAANFIAQTKDLSPRGFDTVSSTVMKGSYHVTHAAGKRWIDQGLKGNVLSTLTTWVWTGSAFVVPSAMGKAAVNAMTMSLGVEWAKYGIRINAIAPGPIPTEYAWEMLNPTENSSAGATQFDTVPAGRPGTIEELANLTIFMLTDACDYITGQTIVMDGGQMLAGPGTFAGLTSMTDEDWAEAREKSKATNRGLEGPAQRVRSNHGPRRGHLPCRREPRSTALA